MSKESNAVRHIEHTDEKQTYVKINGETFAVGDEVTFNDKDYVLQEISTGGRPGIVAKKDYLNETGKAYYPPNDQLDKLSRNKEIIPDEKWIDDENVQELHETPPPISENAKKKEAETKKPSPLERAHKKMKERTDDIKNKLASTQDLAKKDNLQKELGAIQLDFQRTIKTKHEELQVWQEALQREEAEAGIDTDNKRQEHLSQKIKDRLDELGYIGLTTEDAQKIAQDYQEPTIETIIDTEGPNLHVDINGKEYGFGDKIFIGQQEYAIVSFNNKKIGVVAAELFDSTKYTTDDIDELDDTTIERIKNTRETTISEMLDKHIEEMKEMGIKFKDSGDVDLRTARSKQAKAAVDIYDDLYTKENLESSKQFIPGDHLGNLELGADELLHPEKTKHQDEEKKKKEAQIAQARKQIEQSTARIPSANIDSAAWDKIVFGVKTRMDNQRDDWKTVSEQLDSIVAEMARHGIKFKKDGRLGFFAQRRINRYPVAKEMWQSYENLLAQETQQASAQQKFVPNKKLAEHLGVERGDLVGYDKKIQDTEIEEITKTPPIPKEAGLSKNRQNAIAEIRIKYPQIKLGQDGSIPSGLFGANARRIKKLKKADVMFEGLMDIVEGKS